MNFLLQYLESTQSYHTMKRDVLRQYISEVGPVVATKLANTADSLVKASKDLFVESDDGVLRTLHGSLAFHGLLIDALPDAVWGDMTLREITQKSIAETRGSS